MPSKIPEPIAYVQLAVETIPSIYVEDWTDIDLRESEPAHRHNYHLVMWFCEGTGRQGIYSRWVNITPHTLTQVATNTVSMA